MYTGFAGGGMLRNHCYNHAMANAGTPLGRPGHAHPWEYFKTEFEIQQLREKH